MTRQKSGILIIGVLLFATFIATIIYKPKSPGIKNSGTSSIVQHPSISVKVFQSGENWGYEIFRDSARYIYQETIPGLQGNQHFSSHNDALKCGELVCRKLRAGKNPSVSKEELEQLEIKFNVLN
jgi:hypothetical protein